MVMGKAKLLEYWFVVTPSWVIHYFTLLEFKVKSYQIKNIVFLKFSLSGPSPPACFPQFFLKFYVFQGFNPLFPKCKRKELEVKSYGPLVLF